MPKRPETPIVDLATLTWSAEQPQEFASLEFPLPEAVRVYGSAQKPDSTIQYTFQEIRIDEEVYQFAGFVSRVGNKEHPNEQYTFCLGKETGRVSLKIDILPYAGRQTARTDVERLDAGRGLKMGLGVEMYKTIFPFLQHLANTRQQPVDHIIEVDNRPEARLTPAKWEEVFLPTLTAQGYVPSGKFFHDKVYTPEPIV